MAYFAGGVQEVWYIYPRSKEVHQFRGAEDYVVLRGGDQLSSTLLPEFGCPVSELLRVSIWPAAND